MPRGASYAVDVKISEKLQSRACDASSSELMFRARRGNSHDLDLDASERKIEM